MRDHIEVREGHALRSGGGYRRVRSVLVMLHWHMTSKIFSPPVGARFRGHEGVFGGRGTANIRLLRALFYSR